MEIDYNEILKNNFQKDKIKDKQKLILKIIIEEKRDCLGILSTGYGKSICYQLPYFINYKTNNGKITRKSIIVISPLIALMEDQKKYLKTIGINTYCLNSSLNQYEKKDVENKLENKEVMIVYMT